MKDVRKLIIPEIAADPVPASRSRRALKGDPSRRNRLWQSRRPGGADRGRNLDFAAKGGSDWEGVAPSVAVPTEVEGECERRPSIRPFKGVLVWTAPEEVAVDGW